MIKLYNSDRQTVIKVLNPTQSIVTRQLMGGWSMEMFHPFNEAGALIERGLYIECSTPKGLQKFKVRMVTKISENTIRVTAFHRFYDLCNNYVRDTNVVGKNRQQAISQILSNTLRPTTFTVEGHSTNTNNLRIVGLDPFTAIVGNQDNSVINRFGGEWDCDNDKIIVEDYIGNDRGYLVAWDKNMTELNESIDDTELITQIIPVGRERLMLPELTVDSIYITSYEDVYTREISFSDIGVDEDNNIDEAEAQSLLRLAAKKYFRETECDILKANYEVSIKDIKNNPKYEECSFFYTLDIGDFVTVLKNNGLRIKVRLLEYQYDSIKEEFISFKLNALGKKLTSNTTGIQEALDKILNTNGSLNSEKLEGLINMLTVSMGAMVDSAEKHRAKAILFEDRIPSSPTYGAMAVGTKGFMIASEFDATKQDWKWRTFGTGKGFVADLIIAGIIKGAGDDLIINLDNGSVTFKKGLITGRNTILNLDDGTFNFGDGALKHDGKALVCNGTFKTGEAGQSIEVSDADYKVLDGSNIKGFFGFRKVDYDNYLIPRFAIGHTKTSGENNYFAINPYKGNKENPQTTDASYVDLSYKTLAYKDWSNIKMYEDGNVRVAPIKNLEITTNFVNGEYADENERRLALFTTSTLEDYNSNLQVGAVCNHSNGNGLILADRFLDNCWSGSEGENNGGSWRTAVRIHTDNNNNKFFRPLTTAGDIECGSLSYPWKKVTTVTTMSSNNVIYNEAMPTPYVLTTGNVLDNINFLPTPVPFVANGDNVSNLLMDVTNIVNTNYVELSDEGKAFINESELLKLALMEIKQLKDRVADLEKGERLKNEE